MWASSLLLPCFLRTRGESGEGRGREGRRHLHPLDIIASQPGLPPKAGVSPHLLNVTHMWALPRSDQVPGAASRPTDPRPSRRVSRPHQAVGQGCQLTAAPVLQVPFLPGDGRALGVHWPCVNSLILPAASSRSPGFKENQFEYLNFSCVSNKKFCTI